MIISLTEARYGVQIVALYFSFYTLHSYSGEPLEKLDLGEKRQYHLWVVSNQRLDQFKTGHEYSHMISQLFNWIPNPDDAGKKGYYKSTTNRIEASGLQVR